MAKANRICAVEGCGKKHFSKGYCVAHLRKVEKYGDPLAGKAQADNVPRGVPCFVAGCGKPSIRRGYCSMHNKRLIRHGSVDSGNWVIGTHLNWLRSHVNDTTTKCVPWPFRVEENGYGSLWWKGKTTPAHRMMCNLAHGEPPDEQAQAAHSCNNRSCVNPRHLRWATPQENSLEKNDHGTMLIGETNPAHVLTIPEVRSIRAMAGTCALRVAAERYSVSITTIHRIWHRKAWAWLN